MRHHPATEAVIRATRKAAREHARLVREQLLAEDAKARAAFSPVLMELCKPVLTSRKA